MYLSSHWMIFVEAGHALHFGIYKTKMKSRLFRRRAFAEVIPMCLNGVLIEFRDFTHNNVQASNAVCIRLARLEERLIEYGFCGVKFAHCYQGFKYTTSGRSISRILSNGLLRLCDHLSGRRVAAPLGAAYPGLALSPRERAHMKTSSLPPSADDFVPAWPCSRRGLPGHPHYCRCRWSFTPPFHHHPSRPLRGEGLFVSVALLSGRLAPHGGFPAPGAIRRRALWSADFPRSRKHRTAIAQPT